MFILYRHQANITSRKGEDIRRLLTFSEVVTLCSSLIKNKI